jgi:hypothetical protein
MPLVFNTIDTAGLGDKEGEFENELYKNPNAQDLKNASAILE